MTDLHNNKSQNTIWYSTCQSNNLIYCLGHIFCNIMYIDQTRGRITDRFQGHIFYIKHV